MKIEELERLELREKILSHKSEELFEVAAKIWEKKNGFDRWSKWKKFFHGRYGGKVFYEIKEIQMELLDKEVEECVKEVKAE